MPRNQLRTTSAESIFFQDIGYDKFDIAYELTLMLPQQLVFGKGEVCPILTLSPCKNISPIDFFTLPHGNVENWSVSADFRNIKKVLRAQYDFFAIKPKVEAAAMQFMQDNFHEVLGKVFAPYTSTNSGMKN